MEKIQKFKFQIKLDLEKDAENWWQACNRISHGTDWGSRIDPDILSHIKGKTKEDAYKFLIPYLQKKYLKEKKIIDTFIKETTTFFDSYFNQACEKMAEVTGKPLYRDEFIIYITTFPRGPYNKNEGSMLVYIGWEQPLKSFLHELCHFQFIHYWGENHDPKIMKLSQEQFEYLKESLTIVIDKSFAPMIKTTDAGYPIHKDFREVLKKQWSKNKNFDDLVRFGINNLNNYLK